MIRYKLTDPKGFTRRHFDNETRWGPNITHEANKLLPAELCTAGVIHGYKTPLLAVMMNLAHAKIFNPVLWEIEVPSVVANDGTKEGYRKATTLRTIPLPKVTIEQRIRFAIYCIKEYSNTDPTWNAWADNWLSKRDRSFQSANIIIQLMHSSSPIEFEGVRLNRSILNNIAVDITRVVRMSAPDSRLWDIEAAPLISSVVSFLADLADPLTPIDFASLAEKAVEDEPREPPTFPPVHIDYPL